MARKEKKAKQGSVFYRVMHALLAWPIRRLYRVRVVGKENLKELGDRGYLICANHLSVRDTLVIGASLPRPIHFVAKAELFRIPVLRTVICWMGAIRIRRGESDVAALKKAIRTVEEGGVVAIYPQGTRHPETDPRDTRLKDGIGMVAFRAKAGILPILVQCKNFKMKAFRRTTVSIGKPIPFDALPLQEGGPDNYRAATEQAFSAVCAMIDESRPAQLPPRKQTEAQP